MDDKSKINETSGFSLRFPEEVQLCITLINEEKLLFEVHVKKSIELYYEVQLTPKTISVILLQIHENLSGLYSYLYEYSKQVLEMIFKEGNIPSSLVIKEWVGKKEKKYHIALQAKQYPQVIKEAKFLQMLKQEIKINNSKLEVYRSKEEEMSVHLQTYEQQATLLKKQYQSVLNQIHEIKQNYEEEVRKRQIREQQTNQLKIQIQKLKAKISQKVCEDDSDDGESRTRKRKHFEEDPTRQIKSPYSFELSENSSRVQTSKKLIRDGKFLGSREDDSIKFEDESKFSSSLLQVSKISSSTNNKMYYQQEESEHQAVFKSGTIISVPKQHDNGLSQCEISKSINICDQNSNNALKAQHEIPINNVKNTSSQPVHHWITILSSNEEQQQNAQFWDTIGRKVKMELDQCQQLSHFALTKVRSGRLLQKTSADDLTTFLYHAQPVKEKQHFTVTISEIKAQDFIFGAIGKEILASPELKQGSNIVCLNGLMQQIMNQKSVRNVKIWLQKSDSIITAVDLSQNKIWFFLNRTLIGYEVLPKSMRDQCYFFVATGTAGNKIILQ